MKAERGTLEIEEWRPPEVPQAPPARGFEPIFGRGLVGGAVLALHVAAVALFMLPSTLEGESVRSSVAPVITATFIDAESAPGAEKPSLLEPLQLDSRIAIPEPVSFDIPVIETAEAEVLESNEFRPPRLEDERQVSPEEFAADAGIAVTRTARVILTVTVTEQGKASDVTVVVASGVAELDSAAIAYARTLRWQPALVRGRESSMSIRLPVVFPATG